MTALGESVVPAAKTGLVTRRTSIRQSLNLASVSKAFADVINKDNKDASKGSKKSKESRRLSAVNLGKPSAPRASMGDAKSPSQLVPRMGTPDSKVVTRRRVSATMQRSSSDEQPSKSGDSANNTPTHGIFTRAATLRSKNINPTASSLPKYRPKSAVVEQQKQPPSPVAVRAGTRRPFSSSDDEKEEKRKADATPIVSPVYKGARAISPLPQRAALKPLNTTTPTPSTPTKVRTSTPISYRGSPTRPTKTVKTTTTASAVSRPPSSSSSNSIAPHTPKTPVVKPTLRRTAQDKNKSQTTTPTAITPHPESPSPVARHARSLSKTDGPIGANMSHISEGVNEDDEDEEDVKLLLAPTANMAAPTPAMPRIQKTRSRKGAAPKTPTRGVNQLPTRANMSYLSPPHFTENSSALLRPPQPRPSGNGARNAGRGSILSWEQLASEASKTLGDDEIEKMLADIPAPFRSGPASPTLSATLEIPESPCLSALDSPSGYGSISQVLLPDVTPSPAAHSSQRFSLSRTDGTSVDSPAVTLLRLQLAQAESIARERLMQMQAMEEEIHGLKETHTRQMQETARHIAHLEANERNGAERIAYTSSLENQLRLAEAQRKKAIQEATKEGEAKVRRSWEIERQKEKSLAEAGCIARLASSEWMSVREVAEADLDLVKGDRAVLSVLLAELDQLGRALSS